jgi:hypothetical protein
MAQLVVARQWPVLDEVFTEVYPDSWCIGVTWWRTQELTEEGWQRWRRSSDREGVDVVGWLAALAHGGAPRPMQRGGEAMSWVVHGHGGWRTEEAVADYRSGHQDLGTDKMNGRVSFYSHTSLRATRSQAERASARLDRAAARHARAHSALRRHWHGGSSGSGCDLTRSCALWHKAAGQPR